MEQSIRCRFQLDAAIRFESVFKHTPFVRHLGDNFCSSRRVKGDRRVKGRVKGDRFIYS